ncbi:MAG: hypothetical protein H6625_10080 [Bdellovibrionaceae bacterium]|nr:hypothetical protein [Pseudobdellovibrionaceae bacterium]
MSFQKFYYHSLVKKIYKIFFIFLLLMCVIIIRWKLESTISSENLLSNVINILLSLSVPLSLLVRLLFVVRPRIYSSYTFEGSTIIVDYLNNKKILDIKNIDDIVLTLLPPRWFGGFKVRFKSGQKLVFLSLLERNYQLLEYILKLRPELMPKNKASKYVKAAKLFKNSWERSLQRFKYRYLSAVKFLLIPILIAVIFTRHSYLISQKLSHFENYLGLFTLVLFAVVLLQVFLTTFEDIVLHTTAVENKDSFIVNPSAEKWSFLVVQCLYFLIISFSIYLLVK